MTHSALLRSPAVFPFRVYLGTALALSAIAATLADAQLTDEEKKRKAREEMRAVASPTPAETPEPSAKPKPATRKSKTKRSPTPTPKPTATAKKSATPEPDESPTPKPKPKSEAQKSDAEEEGTPKPKARAEATESPEPTADKKSPKPEVDKSPKPKATPGAKKSDTEEEATPKAKAKPADSPEPTKSSAAKKSPTPKADKSPTPKKKPGKKKPIKKKPSAKKGATPKPKKAEPTKTPSATATPAKPAASESARPPISEPFVVPRATPPPPPPQAALPSDITIEKSGLEQEQGFEPPPPPPRRRGFWPWSRQISYRYLTSANIEAIRRAPVQRARWKFIIVHNSGTRQGNARAFDYYHRKVRRMRNGMAYHFVIGNGTSSRNGGIEIGDRWRRQVNGGHVHSDYMNNIGLGICLVGDFNRDQPTRAQLEATEELIRYLQERCGKSDGRAPMVRPHREVNPPRWATDCPGDAFPYGWFGRFR